MNRILEQFDLLADAPDGIAKLRQLILQLAVQGKLVPQDKNEKNKFLGLESKKKLPNNWIWQILPNVIERDKYAIKRGPFGSSIKKAYFVTQGYKVYEQKNAINNDFTIGHYYIDEKKYEELKAFKLEANDIIISCSGTIGKVAIVPPNFQKGIINQALLKISLNTTILLNEYFAILFPAYFMRGHVLNNLLGTAIKNIVSVKQLKSIKFPLPPLVEQKRIVAKVDQLMHLCDELEQRQQTRHTTRLALNRAALNTLVNAENEQAQQAHWSFLARHFDDLYSVTDNVSQLKNTILQLAVQGKLVPQDPDDEPASELLKRIRAEKEKMIAKGTIKKEKPLPPIGEDEVPYEVPRGWEWVRLKDIGITQTGTTPPKNNPIYFGNEYPFIKPADISENRVNYENEKLSSAGIKVGRLITKGSVLMVCIGGSIGKVNYTEKDSSCNQQINTITPYSNLSYKYLTYLMRSAYFQGEVILRAPQTTLPILSKGKWELIPIPLPPSAEQNRIVAKVDQLMKLCKNLEQEIKNGEQKTERFVNAVVNGI